MPSSSPEKKSLRDRSGDRPVMNIGAGLLAAALALPAIQMAHAESPPEEGVIGLKYLSYQDSQPGAERIRVRSPALSIMTPFAGDWMFAATHVVDSISGASPAYHTEVLSKMHDLRRGTDISATRYFPGGTLTASASYSAESDYLSRGLNLGGTFDSDDKNTTWNFGLGLSRDRINPTNQIVQDETKHVDELSLGVTQVLTKRDIAQIILGYSHGQGYFSDPYKIFDNRPRERNHTTFLARWNHHFPELEGTSRLSYRYYTDTYKIRAHTLSAEYVQPLPSGWTVTPMARLYSQSAASFFVDLAPNAAPFPTNPPANAIYYTEDQRLSAYGAHSFGIRVGKELFDKWLVDFRIDRYEQRSTWKLSGGGSPGLAPFVARSSLFGLSRRF